MSEAAEEEGVPVEWEDNSVTVGGLRVNFRLRSPTTRCVGASRVGGVTRIYYRCDYDRTVPGNEP